MNNITLPRVRFFDDAEFVNIRRKYVNGTYVGIGSPPRFGQQRSEAIFVGGDSFNTPDGRKWLFYSRSNTLYARCCGSGDDTVLFSGIDYHPSAVVRLPQGVVFMFGADEEPLYFDYTPGPGDPWNRRPLVAEAPFALRRLDAGVETVPVPAVKLAGSYDSRSVVLRADDGIAVGDTLCKAYTRLVDSAASAGRYVQPVMARYRIVSRDGVLLYESAPVLIAPDTGAQCLSAAVSVPAPGYSATEATALTAASFGIGIVRVMPESDIERALAARVEVTVTPQLHPVEPQLAATCRYAGHSSAGLQFNCWLPGCNPFTPVCASGGSLAAFVAGVLASPEQWFASADAGVSPFASELKNLRSLRACAASAALAGTKPGAVPPELLPPHVFSAGVAAVNGDCVAYADLSAFPFGGYALHECAVKWSESATGGPSATLVTMADGSTVANSATLSGFSPEALSPLLLYPSGRAVSLTVVLEGRRQTFQLRSTPDGRWAYWLNPSCAPVVPAATDAPFVVSAAAPRVVSYPDYVAVATALRPLLPVLASRCTVGRPVALEPVPGGGLSWEFGRGGFYVMGPGGTEGVTVSKGYTSLATSHIDSRCVSHGSAVARIPGAVAAVAGGQLVRFSGSRVSTLRAPCSAIMLGYSPQFNELWAVTRPVASTVADVSAGAGIGSGSSGGESLSDVVEVMQPDGTGRYLRTDLVPQSLHSTPLGLVAFDTSGNTRLLATESDRLMRLSFRVAMPLSLPPGPALFTLPVWGGRMSGTLTLGVSHGNPDDNADVFDVAVAKINGPLSHPVALPFVLPHCHRLHVSFEVNTATPTAFAIPL